MSVLRGATRKFVEESFLVDTDECIQWPFSLDRRGYPQATDAKGFYKPHRRICEMFHGNPPTEKHHAAHECGVRACINKRHLSWKTPKDNEQDKRMHGTYTRGPKRKLAYGDIIEIRRRREAGETLSSIARDYGITHGSVRGIVTRRSYQEIV